MNEAQVNMKTTVQDEISRVVMSIESDHRILMVANIANIVQSRIDEHRVSPKIVEWLSTEELKQKVREFLRHRHDPVQKAKDNSEQGDMFSEILQDYYPVKREVLGVLQPVYVPRDELTHEEVEKTAAKLEKVGDALLRHAEALIAWDAERE